VTKVLPQRLRKKIKKDFAKTCTLGVKIEKHMNAQNQSYLKNQRGASECP
jgi:hypothetical protein